MGALGTYLANARKEQGLDLHDAAQQTRISIHYLKALEEDDFSKLPGEVFVKGFLKNYARFLNLPESEVMQRYKEARGLQPASTAQPAEQPEPVCERSGRRETPLEPFIWAGAIFIAFIILFFTSMPDKRNTAALNRGPDKTQGIAHTGAEPSTEHADGKLYLEIFALEDTWALVRTDSSPQKKAVLRKGESVIWSASERFILSYGGVGTLRLVLNGRELSVNGPRAAVVRDMMINSTGIVSQNIHIPPQPQVQRPKPQPAQAQEAAATKPEPQSQPAQTEQPQPDQGM